MTAARERLIAIQTERRQLSAAYRAWRLHDLKRLVAAEPRLLRLYRWAKSLHIGEGKRLVQTIERQHWLIEASEQVRFAALSLIGGLLIAKREAAGLVPFDDPLPWSGKENARIAIKRILKVT